MANLIGLVLKKGGEFTTSHVNWLLKQIPGQYQVVCLTDAWQTEINCPIIPLVYDLPGWWSKMEIFRPDMPNMPMLYLDLDTVIIDLVPDFWESTASLMLRDFHYRHQSASGMMLINPKDRFKVWEAFYRDPESHIRNHALEGDQGFIRKHLEHDWFQKVMPDLPILSYKVDIDTDSKLYKAGGAELKDAKVVCFHGQPRPWNVKESWVPQ